MRSWKWKQGYKFVSFMLLSVFLLTAGQVSAYGAEYTYTVRLYAGNQGELLEGGIKCNSKSAKVSYGKDCTVISGLKYGDTVYIRPQEAAAVTDSRYYVKGVRRSGRDNSEAEAPVFGVASDRDFVVAYGISGDVAAYQVNYLDLNGNSIMESDTYYGNIGERQYVSSRYIEGYQPQALNLVKTISANESENVFDFQYAPVTAQTQDGGDDTQADEGDEDAEGADTEDDGEGDADAQDDANADNPEGGDVPVGGDAGVDIPDNEVPLGGQEGLVDLDDGEVPLVGAGAEKSQMRMGFIPIYVGIDAAALIAFVLSAIYLKRKYSKKTVKLVRKPEDKTSGR